MGSCGLHPTVPYLGLFCAFSYARCYRLEGVTYVTFKQMVSALDRNIDIIVTIQNIQDIPS